MNITIREATAVEVEALVPLLLLAEPSERALRWGLANLVDTTYLLEADGTVAGVATMRWRDEPCEIQELAIAPERQGQGLGRRLIAWLAEEARRRGKQRLVVGTANSNLASIAFYQRCGLRMDSVRRDYFSYYRTPVEQNGIRTRDLLMFSLDLA